MLKRPIWNSAGTAAPHRPCWDALDRHRPPRAEQIASTLSIGRSRCPFAVAGGCKSRDHFVQGRHPRQPCRDHVDPAGHGRALPRDAQRVDAVNEDRGRTANHAPAPAHRWQRQSYGPTAPSGPLARTPSATPTERPTRPDGAARQEAPHTQRSRCSPPAHNGDGGRGRSSEGDLHANASAAMGSRRRTRSDPVAMSPKLDRAPAEGTGIADVARSGRYAAAMVPTPIARACPAGTCWFPSQPGAARRMVSTGSTAAAGGVCGGRRSAPRGEAWLVEHSWSVQGSGPVKWPDDDEGSPDDVVHGDETLPRFFLVEPAVR